MGRTWCKSRATLNEYSAMPKLGQVIGARSATGGDNLSGKLFRKQQGNRLSHAAIAANYKYLSWFHLQFSF